MARFSSSRPAGKLRNPAPTRTALYAAGLPTGGASVHVLAAAEAVLRLMVLLYPAAPIVVAVCAVYVSASELTGSGGCFLSAHRSAETRTR